MIRCGSKELNLNERCLIMGILNVTPDSHSDGGKYFAAEAAVDRALEMLDEGVDIIDIGGESTNPFYSQPVDAEEELRRVLPVVRSLVKRGHRELSIDTRNAETARVCLQEGVSWLNDVSALTFDSQMMDSARNADAIVLMHSRGTPQVMQKNEIHYDDVVRQVADYLRERVKACESKGITKDRIIVDPGIGFGKRLEHNIALLKGLGSLKDIGSGILSGVSRKSFLGEITGIKEPKDRDNATLGAVAHSVLTGANIVRVNNVKATREMLSVFERLFKS